MHVKLPIPIQDLIATGAGAARKLLALLRALDRHRKAHGALAVAYAFMGCAHALSGAVIPAAGTFIGAGVYFMLAIGRHGPR